MEYSETRQFIKEANTLNLSPIEKDVFQYYYSRTQNENGTWFCPDSETADDICRSRNGVCAARKSLIKRGWIVEEGPFQIRILKTFAVRNETRLENSVRNQTETGESQSEIRLDDEDNSPKSDSPVRNQTQTSKNPVRNQTLYKDKRILKEVKLNTKEKENTHFQPPAGAREDAAECVFEEFSNFSKVDSGRESVEPELPDSNEPQSAQKAGKVVDENAGKCPPGNPARSHSPTFPRTAAAHILESTKLICAELGIKSFADPQAWEKQFEWCFVNRYSPFDFLECYRLLKRQSWRAGWLSPLTVAQNLPNLAELKAVSVNLSGSTAGQSGANGSGNARPSRLDSRSQAAIDEFQTIERLRIEAEQRRRKPLSQNGGRSAYSKYGANPVIIK